MNFNEYCELMGWDPKSMNADQLRNVKAKFEEWSFRSFALEDGSSYRAFKVTPTTIDKEERSVEAVILTDEPCMMFDWERGMIPEILPMTTCRMPTGNKMPLADSHKIHSIVNVLGSCVNCRTEQNQRGEFVAKLLFSNDDDGEKAFGKVRDGHITDLSGGYRVYKSIYIEENESYKFEGRTYYGPLKIALDWEPYEGSLCPIGADRFSKIRSLISKHRSTFGAADNARNSGQNTQEENIMSFDQFCRSIGIKPETLTRAQEVAIRAIFSSRCKNLEENAAIDEATRSDVNLILDDTATKENKKRAIQEGIKLENERQSSIRSMCSIPGCEDLGVALIADDKCSVEQARAKVFEHLIKERSAVGTTRTNVQIGMESSEKLIRAATDGLALRSNIAVETPADGADNLRGMSVLRIMEKCLAEKGVRVDKLNQDQIFHRAMDSSDFPTILSNVANLQLAHAYTYSEETWKDVVKIGEGRDFKDMTVAQFSGVPAFSEILPGGGYKVINFQEMATAFAIKTYGCECSFTRTMAINDRLGAFLEAVRLFGVGADKLIGNLVWGLVMANPSVKTLGDKSSNKLFSAAHGNLISAAEAIGLLGMAAMRKTFRLMKDIPDAKGKAETLGLRMAKLVVPAQLEEEGLNLTQNPTMAIDGVVVKNTSFGTKLLVEHRLDADSAANYYGLVDPKVKASIEAAFLNGVQRPQLIKMNERNPDVQSWLARIDVGVGIRDHRSIVKSKVE